MGGRFGPDRRSERSSPQLESRFVEQLVEALRSSGFVSVSAGTSTSDPDIVARRGSATYVFEVKARPVARSSELRGALASAVLEASAWANDRGGVGVGVVAVPRLTDRMVHELEEYAAQVARNAPVIILSLEARPRVIGDPVLRALIQAWDPKPEDKPAVRATAAPALFTDLNGWMLKVLLASRIPPAQLSAPRVPIRSSSELAQVANVSQPTAWRLLRSLESEGYLHRKEYGLELRRVEDLLVRWSEAYQPPDDLRAVWLLRRGDSLSQLSSALRAHRSQPSHRYCLAFTSATSALGLGHARGTVPHVFLENPSDLENLGLAVAAAQEAANVVIWSSSTPEMAFRASVRVGGLAVADVLQCWLDSRRHRARGREQAEYLWNTALADLRRE
jgi:DNA-binding Lrp family transcriptional regulator